MCWYKTEHLTQLIILACMILLISSHILGFSWGKFSAVLSSEVLRELVLGPCYPLTPDDLIESYGFQHFYYLFIYFR